MVSNEVKRLMDYIRHIIKATMNMLFGEFSGIQVFLAPITLLYLIESQSILSSLTNLFSFKLHYFPLIIFLVLLFFVIFMVIKMRLVDYIDSAHFVDRIIELNLFVLTAVIVALIYYALSGFFAYFYGIKGTLKPGLAIIFKLVTATIIVHQYLLNLWLTPYRKRGYGIMRSTLACKAWFRWNKLSFYRFSVLVVAFILLATRLYQLVISYLLIPGLDSVKETFNIDFRLVLFPFNSVPQVFANVLIMFIALLVSNMLFYPFMYAVTHVCRILSPNNTR